MTLSKKTLQVDIYRQPVICEHGGGASNTGEAQIICAADGSPKHAYYIPRKGQLSCGIHAYFVAKPTDIIIMANHHRQDFDISIFEILDITPTSDREYTATIELLYSFTQNGWDTTPPVFLNSAIEAAKAKATAYHCRSPYFVSNN